MGPARRAGQGHGTGAGEHKHRVIGMVLVFPGVRPMSAALRAAHALVCTEPSPGGLPPRFSALSLTLREIRSAPLRTFRVRVVPERAVASQPFTSRIRPSRPPGARPPQFAGPLLA